jgi:hypothetical protein
MTHTQQKCSSAQQGKQAPNEMLPAATTLRRIK